ncbi:MAG: radical SAM protein [Candidatus Eisenbacteria bacterium]|nr:radical SAM protein [Candidatus Eisenbacteria bacterium]
MYMPGAPPTLSVCEIYASILGESTYAGWPCVILRLAGCPLRCAWCDTPYAQQRGEDVPLPEILSRVAAFGPRLVLLTGGEPLAQPGSRYLVSELLQAGNQVVIETGGGVSIQGVDPRACVVLDIKCPGSGMQDRQVWENLDYVKPEDELKFVIGSRSDYEWAKDFLRHSGLAERQVVHFSPVTAAEQDAARSPKVAGVAARELAQWILEDRLPVRLNIQLHVCIWGRGKRGV